MALIPYFKEELQKQLELDTVNYLMRKKIRKVSTKEINTEMYYRRQARNKKCIENRHEKILRRTSKINTSTKMLLVVL